MKVIYASVCDYATFSQDMKPTHIGIFSRIIAREVPATHLQAFFVFGVEVASNEEIESFPIRIECVDPDKEQLVDMRGEAKPHNVAPRGLVTIAHQIVPLPPITMPSYGLYELRVYLGTSQSIAGRAAFEVAAPVPAKASKKKAG